MAIRGLYSILAIGSGLLSPTAASAEVDAGKIARLDTVFAQWSGTASPGCAVSVVQGGEKLAERVYGAADLDLDVKAQIDSIYEAGSASKQFTAAAIILLARDGKLGLDDDIRKYLPELPDYGQRVTIRHMLHHVSGLRDWGGVSVIDGWPRNSRSSTNADVLNILARQTALNFAPGSHYLYSNSNYNLLAIVVQRVSGESLAVFAKARIFAPLGMDDTRWRDDHAMIMPRRAHAYNREGKAYVVAQTIEDAYGNAGLLTTVHDLQLWNAALDADRLGPGFTSEMERGIDLKVGERITYASGLFETRYQGLREVSHGGATGGYRAWLARYPAQRLSIALLCNAGDVSPVAIGHRVADIFLPDYRAATVEQVQARRPDGLYVNSVSGFPVRFSSANGLLSIDGRQQQATASGQWKASGGSYLFSEKNLLTFETEQGERIAFRKVDFSPHSNMEDYAGRYCSVDKNGCISIRYSKGQILLQIARTRHLGLDHIYGDVFTFEPDGLVNFIRDRRGKISSLTYGDSRNYNMRFSRTAGD
jgi:CubicO group peptidase (beta-lactamase class C family)